MTGLATIFKGWDEYNQTLVEALAPLTEDQLALRAAPHLRPIRDLAGHIVSTRIGWFHGGLHVGDAALEKYYAWNQPDGAPQTAAELVTGLHESWAMIAAALASWTTADLADEVRTTWANGDYLLPRQFVIWHVIEHDVHHGGELFFTLGLHQLPTPEVGRVMHHVKKVEE